MFYLDARPILIKMTRSFRAVARSQGPPYPLFLDIRWIISCPFKKVGCLLLLMVIESKCTRYFWQPPGRGFTPFCNVDT
jgi:hypothetical protein